MMLLIGYLFGAFAALMQLVFTIAVMDWAMDGVTLFTHPLHWIEISSICMIVGYVITVFSFFSKWW